VLPDCQVPTAEIFSAEELTRNSPAITICAYLAGEPTRNDCLDTVLARFPPVNLVYEWLKVRVSVRLSGTGAAFFCEFDQATEAEQLQLTLPDGWNSYVVSSVLHPHRDMG
jgi:4-diphosphocytidyl-2-C-methyl-D-erythritol kinase